MEKFEIQCNSRTVWREANIVLFKVMQIIDSDLVSDYDSYNRIREWNRNRVRPLHATSSKNFWKRNINGLVVYITQHTRFWKTIPRFNDKATLVIYVKRVDYILARAREHFYRLRSDDEKGDL